MKKLTINMNIVHMYYGCIEMGVGYAKLSVI